MILLAGATLVLPDRLLERASLLIDGDRIAAIEPRDISEADGAQRVDLTGALIAPGFIDLHVHGVEGRDVLDGPGAVREVAARLPRYGVTAFCPTSIACDPAALDRFLTETAAEQDAGAGAARVIAAHLESNFINPDYNGAQPIGCLRSARWADPESGSFTGREIVETIERRRAAVGIVTVAPEIAGGLDLVRRLSAAGIRVSIGHSGGVVRRGDVGDRRGCLTRDTPLQSHVADVASCAGCARRGAQLPERQSGDHLRRLSRAPFTGLADRSGQGSVGRDGHHGRHGRLGLGRWRKNQAWRTSDRRDGPHGRTGRRHPRGQRADDGRRVSDAGAGRGRIDRGRGADVRHHARRADGHRSLRTHRRGGDCRPRRSRRRPPRALHLSGRPPLAGEHGRPPGRLR